jgi:hypothetical protein
LRQTVQESCKSSCAARCTKLGENVMLFSKIVEQPVTARIHLNLEKLQKIEKPQNHGYAACRELRGQQRGWSRSQLRKSTIRTIPRSYHLAEKRRKGKKKNTPRYRRS